MAVLDASEVFKVAVTIETNGEALYRHAQTLTDDPKTRDMFAFLAAEEAKHKKTFEEIARGLGTYVPTEDYPGEYLAYLRAYADNIVFPPDEMEEEIEDLCDAEDAVDFAMQREIESILYYIEIRSVVAGARADEVDRIIAEERKHYLQLAEVKKTLD